MPNQPHRHRPKLSIQHCECEAQDHCARTYHGHKPGQIPNLFNSAAMIVKHHATLPGVGNVLIISMQHCKIMKLSWTSQIKELVSQCGSGEAMY